MRKIIPKTRTGKAVVVIKPPPPPAKRLRCGRAKFDLIETQLPEHLADSTTEKTYQIVARRTFYCPAINKRIRKGELGGYVSGFDNLRNEGSCWIGAESGVFGNFAVTEDGYVGSRARCTGTGRVEGEAVVFEAKISNANIGGDAVIIGSTITISGSENNTVLINGDVRISGRHILISGNTVISGSILIENLTPNPAFGRPLMSGMLTIQGSNIVTMASSRLEGTLCINNSLITGTINVACKDRSAWATLNNLHLCGITEITCRKDSEFTLTANDFSHSAVPSLRVHVSGCSVKVNTKKMIYYRTSPRATIMLVKYLQNEKHKVNVAALSPINFAGGQLCFVSGKNDNENEFVARQKAALDTSLLFLSETERTFIRKLITEAEQEAEQENA